MNNETVKPCDNKEISQKNIAYMMSRFPHLPEVFILREMEEMSRQGWSLKLYPLIIQKETVVHHEANAWLKQARPLPFLSIEVIRANIKAFWNNRRLYLSIWKQAVVENVSNPSLFIRSILLLPKAIYAAELMKAEKIEHIHAHYATYPAFVAWVIHRMTNISYSITVHAHDIFVHHEMMATKMRSASFIASISEYNRNFLTEIIGDWVREKIFIVRCGIIPEKYTVQPKHWGNGRRIELISTGSLQLYKGQRYLIEACFLLKKRGIPFHCRIIGEGKERQNLQELISNNNLEKYITLLGAKTQEEVAELLQTAHCYIQPSIVLASGKKEGIPVALMEAMVSGLAVVATSISGIPELVQEGQSGYTVQPEDSEQLADTIEEIYSHPQAALTRAFKGRKLVLEEFELRKNVLRLSSLINKNLCNRL
ncbi:MAG: colanic acid biosynthesis glycosyltransferase WcaL [Bacteroidetes bacterium]|nr:colanic acid biosynthesis glycosyltransferase WcaL [Bacteroidota bacterium]